MQRTKIKVQSSIKFSGDFVGRVTPVPIPNTEVKPAGADGTARETAWESRKSPGLIQKPARDCSRAGFPFLRTWARLARCPPTFRSQRFRRSEEHTSELQSPC